MAKHRNIDGVEKVEAVFQKLPRAVAEKMTAAMNQSGHEMVKRAKTLAPQPGREQPPQDSTGKLRDSIKFKIVKTKKGAAIQVYVAAPKSDPDAAYYARWIEFGRVAQTRGTRIVNKSGRARISGGAAFQPARPFFWPAYWSVRNRIRGRVRRAVNAAAREVARSGR